MTNYDKLIDAIANQMYLLSVSNETWNEIESQKTSRKILEIVEEFQSLKSNIDNKNS
jgi:hypothetical protein